MAQVCVSRNFEFPGGELTAQPWSVPRHVFDTTFNSTGDGAFGQQTTLPGKLMIDSGIQTWNNTSPLDAMVLLRVYRAYRDYVVSNPNVVQIRDRFTTSIGTDDPRVPDTSNQYQGATGGGVDFSSNTVTQPLAGKLWMWEDANISEDWAGPVAPGTTFKFWYRCYLWTPPPWSNNANENNPEHSARVRSARIQLLAFPTPDQAISG